MQMLVWHLLFESCHATRQQRGDRPSDANLTCDTGTSSPPAAASCGIVISARTLRMTRRARRAPSFGRRLLLQSKCEPSKVTEGPRDWSVSPSLRGHQPAVIRTGQNAEEVERTSTLKDGDPNYIMLIGWVHAVLPSLQEEGRWCGCGHRMTDGSREGGVNELLDQHGLQEMRAE